MVGRLQTESPTITTSETLQGGWCLKTMSWCFFEPLATIDVIGRTGVTGGAIEEKMARCCHRYLNPVTQYVTRNYCCSWIHWLNFSFRIPPHFIKLGSPVNKTIVECWTPRLMKLHQEMIGLMKLQRWEWRVCNPRRSGQKRIRFLQIKTYSQNLHCVPFSFLEQMAAHWRLESRLPRSQFRGSRCRATSLGLRVRSFGIVFPLSTSKLSLRSLWTLHLSPQHRLQHRLHLL
jgi:hypothetical protein